MAIEIVDLPIKNGDFPSVPRLTREVLLQGVEFLGELWIRLHQEGFPLA